MRNVLLASTAAVCLMLIVPAANAQSDFKKPDELKKEQVQQPSGAEHQRQAQQHQQGRSTTGQASDEKKDAGKHESTKSESRKEDTSKGAATASEKKDQNAAGKSGADADRHAQSEKSKPDKSKSAADQDKKQPSKSAASESEKKSTANDQKKTGDAGKPATAEAPKSSAQKQENASTPAANTNAKTAPTDKAAAGKAETPNNATANTANQPNTTNNLNAADRKAGQIDPQKKVQISETISRTHDLAPPVRDLGISITVGERVPSHIHLRPLPREIVTIAPEYRDYDYFTTEEDVVIVSPRTHEIVTEIPRDVSRARAEISSSSTSAAMGSSASSVGSLPCQVMQRTAAGDMQPMDQSRLRETTGSGGAQDHLAVKVQGPNGQEMPEVTLPDKQGRIIAETNGSDCRIIVEPGRTDQ